MGLTLGREFWGKNFTAPGGYLNISKVCTDRAMWTPMDVLGPHAYSLFLNSSLSLFIYLFFIGLG